MENEVHLYCHIYVGFYCCSCLYSGLHICHIFIVRPSVDGLTLFPLPVFVSSAVVNVRAQVSLSSTGLNPFDTFLPSSSKGVRLYGSSFFSF